MSEGPLRVLIVDDAADSARMLRVLLKGEGYDVKIEFEGGAALATAEGFTPDVVLLDLSLPGMGGAEVASEMRRRPGLADRAIVAISGHGEEALPSPSPFDRHFQKPLNTDALTAYLADLAARRKSSSPSR